MNPCSRRGNEAETRKTHRQSPPPYVLRQLRFRVPIRIQNLENTPTHETSPFDVSSSSEGRRPSPKPSPGDALGNPTPKPAFRPEGAQPFRQSIGPPLQGGCDDRHTVPRASPWAGYGEALRATRFMVPIRVQNLEIFPTHEPGLHHRGTEARRNKTDRLYLCA